MSFALKRMIVAFMWKNGLALTWILQRIRWIVFIYWSSSVISSLTLRQLLSEILWKETLYVFIKMVSFENLYVLLIDSNANSWKRFPFDVSWTAAVFQTLYCKLSILFLNASLLGTVINNITIIHDRFNKWHLNF